MNYMFDKDITIKKGLFNLNIEFHFETKKWGFASVAIIDNSYSKGCKLITGLLIGPVSFAIEWRYKMGIK